MKLIQVFSPLSSVITRPLHNGSVTSITTLTQKKLPPSSSTAPIDFWISPIVSHKFSATFRVTKLTGMLWTYTQKGVLVKLISWTGTSPKYLCITIRCLSKLQGWLFSILSTPSKLSKTNKIVLLPRFLILNPLFVHHNCLKVLATASIWRKREVKNFAAIMNSPFLWSSGRT